MARKKKLAGPTLLTTSTTTNIYNQASALLETGITHIHIANRTGQAAAFSLWVDATGGNTTGKELFKGKSVPANDSYDWYGYLPLTSADFLVGGSDTASALVITVEGELYAV